MFGITIRTMLKQGNGVMGRRWRCTCTKDPQLWVRHGDCLSVSLAVAGISLTFQLVCSIVWSCFCGFWLCFCVLVVVWLCFCGGVFVVLFLWCFFCGGAFVVRIRVTKEECCREVLEKSVEETTRSDMDSYELRCWSLWAKQMRARRILQAPARQRIVCAPSAHWLAEKFVCVFFAFLESFSVLCKYWKVLQWYYSVLQSTTPYTKVVPSTTKYCSVLQSTTPH